MLDRVVVGVGLVVLKDIEGSLGDDKARREEMVSLWL
jgi:hypothetical protein